MAWTRRGFLQSTLGLALPSGQLVENSVFAHGVASGDPRADAVVLWTRVSGLRPEPVVAWRVFSDEARGRLVAHGSARTSAERDFTVKLDVTGLDAGTTYRYEFETAGVRSPLGERRRPPPSPAR